MKKGLITGSLSGLIIGVISLLYGCLGEPQSSENTGKNGEFHIEYLFEKDGIKMYRFYDGGRFHYFTTNGETMSEQTSGDTHYEERIKTKTGAERKW